MLVPATPPPITTTRAWSSATSAPGGREPVVELRIGHRGREPVEVLLRVFDVVDVQRRQTLLDDAPHRLTEVRHDPHELQPRAVRVGRLTEVEGEQPLL